MSNITIKGILAIDTDGIGPKHGDDTAQNKTSAKIDKHGKFVRPSDPAGIRFLNADTDEYAVAPENHAGTLKVGDKATVKILSSGKTFTAPIGDFGPPDKAGEFSVAAIKAMGVEVLEHGGGPIPTLDGKKASDIHVEVTFFPGSAS